VKIFLDTANIAQIKEANDMGLLDGVTTNPTLVSQEKEDPEVIYSTICRMVKGSVSVETTSNNTEEIIKQGHKITEYGKNATVKVACTREGLKAVKILEDSGIPCNVTLIFSPTQAFLAAKAGATIISPFIGRLDDISYNGMDLIRTIISMLKPYDYLKKTQVLVASIRHPVHVVEAAQTGAQIATMPAKVFDMLFKHPLTDIGLERFLKDWESVKARMAQKVISP
jgi:transaldolase